MKNLIKTERKMATAATGTDVALRADTSPRATRMLAKKATREQGLSTPGAIPFADLANEPLYQRIADATCPEELKEDLRALGIDTAARVASYSTPTALNAELARRNAPAASADLMRRAQREAVRTYRLMRHTQAMQDPINKALRHTTSTLSADMSRALAEADGQSYAKPNSLQSDQSPAAYLCYLYRIATGLDTQIGIIPPGIASHRLDQRRPDLADLRLTEANLKQEVPTISLVNDLLQSVLGTVNVASSFTPIALPFDETAQRTRTALAQIGGSTLNHVAMQTDRTSFPFRDDARLARDLPGLLGLEHSEIALLQGQLVESVPTLGGLFDAENTALASRLSDLMSSLDLTFDGVAQLLGLYAVAQETGAPVAPQDFATSFIGNTQPFTIVPDGEERTIHLYEAALEAPVLRSLNLLARLHHATALDFHHLNWLLAIPGASADSHATDAGLRVLAAFPLYREAFDLSVDGYAALFGEISPFRRADEVIAQDDEPIAGLEQTEVSFLRALFGEEAADLQARTEAGTTPITDPAFAAIISRGLGLTAAELCALTEALDPTFSLSAGVDAKGLAALYRLGTVFRLFGWSVTGGLQLIACLTADTDLSKSLLARVDTPDELAALCDALDQLAALARWMDSAEIPLETLCAILTPTRAEALQASDAEQTWLEGLKTACAPLRIQTETFLEFQDWHGSVFIEAETWLAGLQTHGEIIHPSGIFQAGITVDKIETAVTGILEAASVDPEHPQNAARREQLVNRLARLHDNQFQAVLANIATLSRSLTAAGAEPLTRWAQTNPLDLLDILLTEGDDQPRLVCLKEIKRHVTAVEAFGFGDIDLWIVGHRQNWLSATFDTTVQPLDLEQLFHLQAFATLQVGAANDATWRGYLAFVNEGHQDADRTEWHNTATDTLAILLGTTTGDMTLYLENILEPKRIPTDIETLETIARHVRLADDLAISAEDLLALKTAATSEGNVDWQAAANAAEAGLGRFNHGSQIPAYHHAFAELKRDALVAAYMKNKVAGNPDLEGTIKDRDGLYRHLLLDVDVTSAVPTSPIIEATSSLQLYISRALSGLEPGIDFHDRNALQARWQLDQDYRQWEANQKLARYPQNYIEPELRYITSPEFDELLQAVSSKSIDTDAVEAAVNTYMAGLASRCDLKLCSMFVERKSEGETTYHLLARAQWEPGRYFYRKFDADYALIKALDDPTQYLKAIDWTFWQEVVIPSTYELFSDVSVCYFRNRYFFIWLEIEKLEFQGPEADATSWRIHPRYMRCDTSALTGPMHAPKLFTSGTLDAAGQTVGIDDAYVWTGARPQLDGTYHPARISDAFAFGERQTNPNPGEEVVTAIVVTFGVALRDNAGIRHETSLQLRLTDDWADALHILDESVSTSFDESAPHGYDSVYPRPHNPFAATPDREFLEATFALNRTLNFKYEETGRGSNKDDYLHIFNEFKADTFTSSTHFRTAEAGSDKLGTLDITVDFGPTVYRFKRSGYPYPIGVASGVKEESGTRLFLQATVTADAPGEATRTVTMPETELEFVSAPFNATWGFETYKFPSAPITHVASEKVSCLLPLPLDLAFDGKNETNITIKMKIRRVAPRMNVSTEHYYVDPVSPSYMGDFVTSYHEISAEIYEKTLEFDIGSFKLSFEDTKFNSGWSHASDHGNKTFLHLTADQKSPVSDTFLLMNSSSALTELSRSMPRPGGCEGLFTRDNQVLPETPGPFIAAFAETLEKLYPTDGTKLNPIRTPGEIFDFDGPFGGYGWEIFYHIPSAIAAGYAKADRFDEALRWLDKIFNPKADIHWRLQPLAGVESEGAELTFDNGEVIIDPDRIAQDYPFYYKQATLRHYLETLISAGDAIYRDPSQEALQRAKSIYVTASQLFSDKLSDTLEIATATAWTDPTLADASDECFSGFLPPYNKEMRDLYDVIEERLSNLRNWRDIDGEPLNVPLLSVPVDPRELQLAAKSALSLRSVEFEEEDDRDPVFDFITVARAAKGYIANLKTTSSRLQSAIEKGDGSRMAKKTLTLNKKRANRSVKLQDFAVTSAEREVAVKEAALAGAQAILINHVSDVFVQYGFIFVENAVQRSFLLLNMTVGGLLRKTY
ncbi:MAG: neuraminidase-like domain-containing protein, partial [Pseudomonadota bacterium]